MKFENISLAFLHFIYIKMIYYIKLFDMLQFFVVYCNFLVHKNFSIVSNVLKCARVNKLEVIYTLYANELLILEHSSSQGNSTFCKYPRERPLYLKINWKQTEYWPQLHQKTKFLSWWSVRKIIRFEWDEN